MTADEKDKRYESQIAPWKMERVLGEGGYGKVYEIQREEFGTVYKAALKAITIPQSQADVTSVMADGMDRISVTEYYREFVSDITKECALMSKFKGNSNIVSYEDHKVIEHTDDIGWDILIRMELLTPMLQYTEKHAMTEENVIKLGVDICKALELCRKNNVIHRDIKPENIFVSDEGNFKLGDFGIARTIEKTTSGLSKTGTTAYMAPEVYKGEDYGFSVDIYSLGIVMYRFLNENRTPFLPPSPQKITYKDREEARRHRMKGEALPEPVNGSAALKAAVLKACSYNSADGFANPTEMRTALESLGTSSQSGVVYGGSNDYAEDKTESFATIGYADITRDSDVTQGPDISSKHENLFKTVSLPDNPEPEYTGVTQGPDITAQQDSVRQPEKQSAPEPEYTGVTQGPDITARRQETAHADKPASLTERFETEQHTAADSSQKSKKPIIIAAACAAVVACIVCAVLFIGGGSSDTDGQIETVTSSPNTKTGTGKYVAEAGTFKFSTDYRSYAEFSDGYAMVSNGDSANKKYGYIDTEGNLVIDFLYDEANSFDNGLALVRNGNEASIINTDGEYIVTKQMGTGDSTYPVYTRNGMISCVDENGKIAFLDASGKQITDYIYDNVKSFNDDGIAFVCIDDKWGCIDKKGKVVVPLEYDDYNYYYENYYMAEYDSDLGFPGAPLGVKRTANGDL